MADKLNLISAHWINEMPEAGEYQIRVRHRANLITTQLSFDEEGNVMLDLKNAERAVAPGQSVVIYNNEVCLGGGIVA